LAPIRLSGVTAVTASISSPVETSDAGGNYMANQAKKWMLSGGVAAAAAGAAACYFLDRKRGKQRRAAFSKKAGRLAERATQGVTDIQHRLQGKAVEVWHGFHRGQPSDRVLEQRIRSRLGRTVAHPRGIHVVSDNGVVTLWGAAAEPEIRRLIRTVESMPGVAEVLNHLEPHEATEPAAPESSSLRQARHETLLNWSPAARLCAGTAGAALAVYGWKRKDRLGLSLSALGVGMAAASTMEKNLHSILAFFEDCPGFELDETIRINAPISDLYDFWANPENYPKVFSHITAIERLGENLYRWTVNGPAGLPIHWEGRITRTIPNTLVEWKSLQGSTVGNFGVARFDPHYDASTRVRIRMFYRPPAGIVGRFLADMLGVNPKIVLEQDLKRLKALFENEEDYMKELRQGGEPELLKTATT
jgi:uncharacterized membrane protein/osmotically-inducible protein OsmY